MVSAADPGAASAAQWGPTDMRLERITGMGHNLPRGAWPPLIRAIAGNARCAEAS